MGQEGDGKQIALWAYKLSFNHPVSKKLMEFKVLPEINRNLEDNWRFRNLIKKEKSSIDIATLFKYGFM